MAYLDLEKSFVLHGDALEEGLGAVLYQRQQGALRVIAYGSRTLTTAERNYSGREKINRNINMNIDGKRGLR